MKSRVKLSRNKLKLVAEFDNGRVYGKECSFGKEMTFDDLDEMISLVKSEMFRVQDMPPLVRGFTKKEDPFENF